MEEGVSIFFLILEFNFFFVDIHFLDTFLYGSNKENLPTHEKFSHYLNNS